MTAQCLCHLKIFILADTYKALIGLVAAGFQKFIQRHGLPTYSHFFLNGKPVHIALHINIDVILCKNPLELQNLTIRPLQHIAVLMMMTEGQKVKQVPFLTYVAFIVTAKLYLKLVCEVN